jgi:cytochrome c-type biogenesis protein CcmH
VSRALAWIVVLLVTLALPGTMTAQEVEAASDSAVAEEAEAPVEQSEDDRSALTDPEELALDARAAEIASGLRCPVCRNQSIVESNAELSREMHAVVRDRLAAGETQEEIEAYFVSRYGEWILLQPQAQGINLLVYVLPLLVLVLGFLLARNRLRKWASAGEGSIADDGPTDLDADDERWLNEALRES